MYILHCPQPFVIMALYNGIVNVYIGPAHGLLSGIKSEIISALYVHKHALLAYVLAYILLYGYPTRTRAKTNLRKRDENENRFRKP